jgi:hypothetical protein
MREEGGNWVTQLLITDALSGNSGAWEPQCSELYQAWLHHARMQPSCAAWLDAHGQLLEACLTHVPHMLWPPPHPPTLFSRGRGDENWMYSVPTHDTMPRPLGRTPGGGVSLSSFSFSIACVCRQHT